MTKILQIVFQDKMIMSMIKLMKLVLKERLKIQLIRVMKWMKKILKIEVMMKTKAMN